MGKRALFAAVTVIGLVLLLIGAWFIVHLGSSGSAVLRARPPKGAVVVIEPSVLNRVDNSVTITAVAAPGTQIWMGRTSPTDARAIVGGAEHISVTGARVGSWSLVMSRAGAGPAPQLDTADIWRQTATGAGLVRLTVDQSGAPESVVIAAPDGRPVALTKMTVTMQRKTWFFQALLLSLVGLLALVVGAAGLWQNRPRPTEDPTDGPTDHPADDPSNEPKADPSTREVTA
ncbi:hypothetical protein BJ986_002326 [Phycicoccus badiiscoriae]|uniref:Uncharacterized protein n=1 Tax=Pedococcus badiiscoriae TaxID=642776 RepID=A0A852WGF7_9MICO|nr:hypothetical protein [Pedococcus badiiscoriae]NYG07839.1 hypothetical protein [Pedococcus badiiscoriae]